MACVVTAALCCATPCPAQRDGAQVGVAGPRGQAVPAQPERMVGDTGPGRPRPPRESRGSSDWADVTIAAAGLGALAVSGLAVFLWLRRRLMTDDETGGDTFTLSGLRQLHKAGKLTDEEFEAAKAALLAEFGTAAKPVPGSGAPAASKTASKPQAGPEPPSPESS